MFSIIKKHKGQPSGCPILIKKYMCTNFHAKGRLIYHKKGNIALIFIESQINISQ